MPFLSVGATSAAGACNEDIFGFDKNAAWILDGATSLSKRSVLSPNGQAISDAAHFVSLFALNFSRAVSQGYDTVQALERALEMVRMDAEIRHYMKEEVDVPSASFSAVKLHARTLQVLNLGDCSILLQADDGEVQQIGSSRVRQLDAELLALYMELKRGSDDRDQIWRDLLPVIRKNRSLMNKPDGYWILEPQGMGVCGLQEFEIAFNGNIKGLLITDGLYRLVDTYKLMNCEDFFVAAFAASGPEGLVKRLRDAEALDPDAGRWPRVKLADDATIVRFETI